MLSHGYQSNPFYQLEYVQGMLPNTRILKREIRAKSSNKWVTRDNGVWLQRWKKVLDWSERIHLVSEQVANHLGVAGGGCHVQRCEMIHVWVRVPEHSCLPQVMHGYTNHKQTNKQIRMMITIWSWLICTNGKQDNLFTWAMMLDLEHISVEMYHLRILRLNCNAQIIVDQASHLIFLIDIASLYYAHHFMRKLNYLQIL